MLKEKQNLLKEITESFINKGFYKTTMDEIASDLRISKKTIYKYFPTKENLIKIIIHGIVFTVRTELKKILKEDNSSIEKLLSISSFFISKASKVNFNAILEMKKMGPQVWSTVERLREREVFANFGRVIDQGQAEGYIVPIPREVILKIIVASIQAVINPEFIIKNEFSIMQAGQMTMEIIFNGILTDEGKTLYKKLKAEQL